MPKIFGVCIIAFLGVKSSMAEEPLPSLYELYSDFISKNGGQKNILELNSVIVTGSILQDDQKVKFRLYRKRPNKMRITINFDTYEISTIFNGREAWREVTSNLNRIELSKIEGQGLATLKSDSNFDSPFYEAFKNRKYITVAAIEEVNGKEAIRLDFDPAGNFGFKSLWLSMEHSQEVKMLRYLPREEETSQEQMEEIFYSGFNLINGIYWAEEMRHFFDKELVKVVSIEEVKPNAGVFDSFFEVQDFKTADAK